MKKSPSSAKFAMSAVIVILAVSGTRGSLTATNSASPRRSMVSHTQTFTMLLSFNGTDGGEPEFKESLVQGPNGNLYGTTAIGGNYSGGCYDFGGCGTVFEISSTGALTSFNFDQTDGNGPTAGLVLATNGNFYGTTADGGANGYGTVFKITPGGALTTLYSFCAKQNCADGELPYAALVQGTDGNLYGTTYGGGANDYGTVFKITPGGALTTLYSFCAKTNCTDGGNLYAGLVEGTDGNFYGTTPGGGANSEGTVFKITASGKLTTLHSFDNSDGESPVARLVQGSDGNFYGTTEIGGSGSGQACDGCGTVFRITPKGALTTLYNFCTQTNCADGGDPVGALIQATDGNFYGTTSINGANYGQGCNEYDTCGGTVFQITDEGTLTTLYSFCAQGNSDCPDGTNPNGGLVQATSGTFYGTTFLGGAYNLGTVFSLDTGLGPFVQTVPTSGKVGTHVIVLGTNLKGSTSVTFNGKASKFKVVSKSEIKTAVPVGATTGFVAVTMPKQKLKSNQKFLVIR